MITFQAQFYSPYADDNVNRILSDGGPMNSSWPMQSHDNRHTGRSPYSTASNSGAEKWRFRCGQVDGGPAIAEDGTIYFGDKSSNMYAVYPNGTLKWQYKVGGWVWSTPAIAETGTIYIGSFFGGGLYALNPNGSLLWRYVIPDSSIASSPAVAPDGTIYFGSMEGSNEGYIYAMNPDGTRKWRYPTGYYIVSDPAIGPDGTIYIGSGDTYLYAMNPTGSLKWRFKTGDVIKGSPSIAADGTVYIGSYDHYLYALYPNNGTMKWRCYPGGTEANPSIAADGTIYIGSNRLYAINPNGTIRWQLNLGPNNDYITQSAPAISADGTIYVGTDIDNGYGGEIIAVNPNGTEQWRKLIANEWVDSSPAIAPDGTVYIGSASANSTAFYGYVHAFNQGPLEVDADGPYLGRPNTSVQFHCIVLGGVPPYTYLWSFGDGGTSHAKNPTYTYTQSGFYNVTLIVTDDEQNASSDSTTALIDNPPNIPEITGPPQGKIHQSYEYTVVTTDPEGDDVYYYIHWGDDSTGWLGPYKSGEEIKQSHTWNRRGTYTIQCKAKDVHGFESDWGTLQVTMPLSYEPPHFRFFEWLFERFPHAFPFLRYILDQ